MFNKKNPNFKGNICIALLALLVICGLFWRLNTDNDDQEQGNDTSSATSQTSNSHKKAKDTRPNMLGHKLNFSKAKISSNHSYYVERGYSNVRYFIDADKKITAIKYILTPPNNTSAVQAALSNLLHDDNLKYTVNKKDDTSIILKPKFSYNVWSPKNKKWYHFSMQTNGEEYKGEPLVSQFSVWKGKEEDAI